MFCTAPLGRPIVLRASTALAVLTLAAAAARAQNAPPLPDVALHTFPAAARESIARVEREATARSTDAQAVGAFARMLHAWEQWDAAHQAYTRAQALAPQTFEWHYLDAVVLQRLARAADAVVQLRAALTLDDRYLPARVKLAEALLDAGDLASSRERFGAITDDASRPAVELGLGRIAAAEGQHAAAIDHFKRAIALYPEFGAAYYALAQSSRALGRRDEARQALEEHARYGARWPAIEDPALAAVTTSRDDAAALLQRGIKLAESGDVEGAIAAHEAALARDPSLAQAHANLISLYGRTRQWARAEQHYRAAAASGVDAAGAHYDYGVLLALQEKWDEAADAYRKALAANPLHPGAHNNLGQILERRGDLEGAAAEYRRALENEPTLRIARFNLGRMLIALGKPDEAIEELQKLTEPRDADAPRYLFALSAAYVRAGRREDGIKWATDAKALALQFGQTELAAAIERNLASIR
jgi:tetratricopeptide (TPR) repeat protein